MILVITWAVLPGVMVAAAVVVGVLKYVFDWLLRCVYLFMVVPALIPILDSNMKSFGCFLAFTQWERSKMSTGFRSISSIPNSLVHICTSSQVVEGIWNIHTGSLHPELASYPRVVPPLLHPRNLCTFLRRREKLKINNINTGIVRVNKTKVYIAGKTTSRYI